jgi:hypothetical protein
MVLDTASRVSEEAKVEALESEDPATEATEPEAADEPNRPDLTGLLKLLRVGLPIAWLIAVFATGFLSGVELAFLVLAAGVLTLVITLMWSSVQSLTGGASLGFEEALGMGAPSRVEEQKRAVLRALKDLEYERGVGKISPEDYAELSARYRAEAKRLIQSVDEALGPARERVESALRERLAKLGLEAPEKPAEVAPAGAAEAASDTETTADTQAAVGAESAAEKADGAES